jgi:uncharacterized membrane-anchored protein
MRKRSIQLMFACAVPVIILLGMTVKPIDTFYKGEEIVLQTVPVDPSDPFRGDYVALQYEAEQIPSQLVEKEVQNELQKGKYGLKVYVSLEKQNGVHVPSKVGLEKPESGAYLIGKLDYIAESFNAKEKEVAYIRYSLDKYFVEDNTGLELEKASAQGDLVAKVKVKNGYAILTDIEEKK